MNCTCGGAFRDGRCVSCKRDEDGLLPTPQGLDDARRRLANAATTTGVGACAASGRLTLATWLAAVERCACGFCDHRRSQWRSKRPTPPRFGGVVAEPTQEANTRHLRAVSD